MTEEKKDSKKEEAKTSTEKSPVEKKPEPQKEEEPLKKQEEEEKKKLEEDLDKEKKVRGDFEKAFNLEKEKRKDLEIKLEAKTQTSETQNEEEPDWFRNKEQKRREETLSLAQKQIVAEFPVLENDVEWDKFKQAHDKYGGPRSHTLEGIKEEYKGFLRMAGIAEKTQPSDSVVEDSRVGDTSPTLKAEEEKADILTRPLNKVEQWAADNFPGGETAWRKKRAEKEE